MKSCLSQWWIDDFTVDNIVFRCMEQYMMYRKALLFNDLAVGKEILTTIEPKEIKALDRRVSNFKEDIWDKEKCQVVFDGNVQKFRQNKSLRDFLLSTGDAVLVEASPYDKVWGIGLKADNPLVNDAHNWPGENLLGFILMEVRDTLAQERD